MEVDMEEEEEDLEAAVLEVVATVAVTEVTVEVVMEEDLEAVVLEVVATVAVMEVTAEVTVEVVMEEDLAAAVLEVEAAVETAAAVGAGMAVMAEVAAVVSEEAVAVSEEVVAMERAKVAVEAVIGGLNSTLQQRQNLTIPLTEVFKSTSLFQAFLILMSQIMLHPTTTKY